MEKQYEKPNDGRLKCDNKRHRMIPNATYVIFFVLGEGPVGSPTKTRTAEARICESCLHEMPMTGQPWPDDKRLHVVKREHRFIGRGRR